MDTRSGITYNDVALYKWLTLQSMAVAADTKVKRQTRKSTEERQRDGPTLEDFEAEVLIPDIIQESIQSQE
jgi:hypothetical protein